MSKMFRFKIRAASRALKELLHLESEYTICYTLLEFLSILFVQCQVQYIYPET